MSRDMDTLMRRLAAAIDEYGAARQEQGMFRAYGLRRNTERVKRATTVATEIMADIYRKGL